MAVIRWRWVVLAVSLVGMGWMVAGGRSVEVVDVPDSLAPVGLGLTPAALPLPAKAVVAPSGPASSDIVSRPSASYTAALIDNPYAEAHRLRVAGQLGSYAKGGHLHFRCFLAKLSVDQLKEMPSGRLPRWPTGGPLVDDPALDAARLQAMQALDMKCADLGQFDAWSPPGASDEDGQRWARMQVADDQGLERQRRELVELGRQGLLPEYLLRHLGTSGYHFEGQRIPDDEALAFFSAVELASDELIYAGFDYAKGVRGLHLCAATGLCSPSLTPREVAMHWARTDPAGKALPKYYDRVLAAIRANRYQAFMAPLR